jgi:hypothetical protein
MEHWFFLCIHLIFVIDRIEHPYAVVEWSDSGSLSDIDRHILPGDAAEGDAWMLHLRPSRSGTPPPKSVQSVISPTTKPLWLPDAAVPLNDKSYRFRFSRIHSQHTRSWR